MVKVEAKIWAYLALLTTYDRELSKLLNDVVNTAYFYCRENFLTELQELVELDEYKDFKGDEFLAHVESLVKDPKEYPMELRFWDNDGVKILEI